MSVAEEFNPFVWKALVNPEPLEIIARDFFLDPNEEYSGQAVHQRYEEGSVYEAFLFVLEGCMPWVQCQGAKEFVMGYVHSHGGCHYEVDEDDLPEHLQRKRGVQKGKKNKKKKKPIQQFYCCDHHGY
jgi:hypothetical protein